MRQWGVPPCPVSAPGCGTPGSLCSKLWARLPTQCPQGLDVAPAAAAVAPALLSYVAWLDHHQVRILVRHVIIPHVRHCPVRHIRAWLLPMLGRTYPANAGTAAGGVGRVGSVCCSGTHGRRHRHR